MERRDEQVTTRFLYFYKCRFCATWACTAGDGGKYVKCNGCGGAKKSEYRQAVDCEHYEKMYRLATERGVLHLPIPDAGRHLTCVRCAGHVMFVTGHRRPDGWVCRACYQAEERPAAPAYERVSEQDDINRMEAAYAALEGKQ